MYRAYNTYIKQDTSCRENAGGLISSSVITQRAY